MVLIAPFRFRGDRVDIGPTGPLFDPDNDIYHFSENLIRKQSTPPRDPDRGGAGLSSSPGVFPDAGDFFRCASFLGAGKGVVRIPVRLYNV
jgi:hypothetical protein